MTEILVFLATISLVFIGVLVGLVVGVLFITKGLVKLIKSLPKLWNWL